MNLFVIFLTGLTVGGLTCMAVQGGLLASTIAQREEERLKEKTKKGTVIPILTFLIAKLIAYTILGFLLGWLGSKMQLSLKATVVLQFAVGFFMIGTALNLLNIHPIFRFFAIQPPRFLTKLVRKQSKSKDMFAPALLGAFTVFIPCGTTQAMMALAIASGNPLMGSAILFAFVLGTSPLFFTLGFLATKLGDVMHKQFMRFAAIAIILLALFNLNNTIALSGSNLTFENIVKSLSKKPSKTLPVVNAQTITIDSDGYTPNNISVKAGSPVTLNIKNKGGVGCTQTFTIPKFGIQKVVSIGQSDTIQFTAPKEKGDLAFMCGMGMIRGNIQVN
ncbi:MAG: sulfite exporter TauE/SafE family protein [Patescibacteria group bacterium]